MAPLWKCLDNDTKDEGFNVVYALEYGDYLKIGSTSNIHKRHQQLKKQATDYCNINLGKCYYTVSHDKYRDTEKQLHTLFKDFRKPGTELFDISLAEFLRVIMSYNMDLSEIDHSKTTKFIDLIKSRFMINEVNCYNANTTYDTDELENIFRTNYCAFCTEEEFLKVMNLVREINTSGNDMLLFNYLLLKLENIIKNSNERYLSETFEINKTLNMIDDSELSNAIATAISLCRENDVNIDELINNKAS